MSSVASLSSRSRSPTSRYQQVDLVSRVEGSTPHALVSLLYAELSVALDVMARAAETDDVNRRLQQHERASTILHTLEAGLDRVKGGDLAMSLAEIYRQMRRRLLAARSGDMAAIREVRDGVGSLAEAWGRITV
jgi:flagellar protein FliS